MVGIGKDLRTRLKISNDEVDHITKIVVRLLVNNLHDARIALEENDKLVLLKKNNQN
jgi:hypothetical protein